MRDFADQFFAVGAQYFKFFGREDFFHFAQIFEQPVLVGDSSRYDVVDGKVAQYTSLDLYLHGVFFQFHFQSAVEFGFVEDTFADQYRFRLVVYVVHQGFRHVADVGQSATGGFLFPFFGVAVALKADGFGGDDRFFQQAEDSLVFSYPFFHQFLY